MKSLRILVLLVSLLLTACGAAAGVSSSPPVGSATPSPSASPTATSSVTQIAVSGAVTGDFQNPVSACNQSHPLPNNQSATAVSATGLLNGKIAKLVILDPAGKPDYESQGYAIFQLQMSASASDGYGWTQGVAPGASPAGIVAFDRTTGATFSLSLIANQQFGAPPGEPNVTVTGTIRCP